MGLFKSIKNLFSRKNKSEDTKKKKETEPIEGIGAMEEEIQTTVNTDPINVLVENGVVENVSD